LLLKPHRKARIKSRMLVIYPLSGDYQEAYATNISESGMYVETPYPLAVGAEVEFFTNYDVLTKGVIPARVARLERKGGRARGMGVRFGAGCNRGYVRDLLLKQNRFNAKYLGLPMSGVSTPRMLLHRLRRTFAR
jgi:Tfp pilus assembly protein PilZ